MKFCATIEMVWPAGIVARVDLERVCFDSAVMAGENRHGRTRGFWVRQVCDMYIVFLNSGVSLRQRRCGVVL